MTIDLRERANAPQQVDLLDATPTVSPTRARSDNRRLVILLIAGTAVVCAVWSTASPAGVALADALYRGGFGALVVWSASRSRRWTWAVLAGTAVVSAATLGGQAIAAIGLAVAVWALRNSRRAFLAGAVVAALAMPVLLTQGAGPLWQLSGGRIDDPFGTSALIVLLATAPVIRSGWRTLSRRKRRSLRKRFRTVAIVTGAVIVGTGAVSALAIPSMRSGLNLTRDAVELSQAGDLPEANAMFVRATESWDRSNRILSGPWMVPSRLVPVLGQHVRAAQVVSGQASAITNASAIATERVNPDDLVIDGAINLEEVNQITPAVDALAGTLERAQDRIDEVNSQWLIPPIGSSVDRSLEILNPASGVTGVAAEALHVGGELLDDDARILVMFTTPAEARGAGGFVGNWALLAADDGRVVVEEQFRTKQLNDLLAANDAELEADQTFVDRYGRFAIERHIQDVTISPDFPTVAPIAADLFAQATGTSVDAVLSVDPFVIEKLLQFTGPLALADGQITGSNAAQVLLADQYTEFGADEAGREAELAGLTNSLFSELLDSPPDPIAFATELAPLAQQQRVSLWLANDFDGSVAERLSLDGAFPRSAEDLFAVVHQNAGQNKIDSFLERTVALRTQLDVDSGTVHHDVTITLDNSAPADGLPDAIIGSNDQGLDLGTNRMLISVYSELPVLSAQVDGADAPLEVATEFGVNVYSLVLTIPPGGFTVIDLEIEGGLDLVDGYDMTLGAQASVAPDVYSWHVFTADGHRVEAPLDWASNRDGVRWAALLDRHKDVSLAIDR